MIVTSPSSQVLRTPSGRPLRILAYGDPSAYVAGLQICLQAGRLAGRTRNQPPPTGTAVNTWFDITANSRNVIANPAGTPSLLNADAQGRRHVSVLALGGGTAGQGYITSALQVTDNFSAFVVFSRPAQTGAAFSRIFTLNGAGNLVSCLTLDPGQQTLYWCRTAASSLNVLNNAAVNYSLPLALLLTARADGVWEVWGKNGLIASANLGAVQGSGTFTIGRDSGGSGLGDKNLYELAVWNRQLTARERAGLFNYATAIY